MMLPEKTVERTHCVLQPSILTRDAIRTIQRRARQGGFTATLQDLRLKEREIRAGRLKRHRPSDMCPGCAQIARPKSGECTSCLDVQILVHALAPMLRQGSAASDRQNCQATLRPSVRGRRKDSERYSGGGFAPPAPVKVGLA